MNNTLKNLISKFHPEARSCLDDAVKYSLSQRCHEIGIEHLLKSIILRKSELIEALSLVSGLEGNGLFCTLQDEINNCNDASEQKPVFSVALVDFIKASWQFSSINWLRDDIVCSAFLAVAILSADDERFLLSSKIQKYLRCNTDKALEFLQTQGNGDSGISRGDIRSDVEQDILHKYTSNLTQLAPTPATTNTFINVSRSEKISSNVSSFKITSLFLVNRCFLSRSFFNFLADIRSV